MDIAKLRSILGELRFDRDAIFMGYALEWRKKVWMSGGAGYVLSSKAFTDLMAFLNRERSQFFSKKAFNQVISYSFSLFFLFFKGKSAAKGKKRFSKILEMVYFR